MGSSQSTAANRGQTTDRTGLYVQDGAIKSRVSEDTLRREYLEGPLTAEQSKLLAEGHLIELGLFQDDHAGGFTKIGTVYKSTLTKGAMAEMIKRESGRGVSVGSSADKPLVLGGAYWHATRGGSISGGEGESLAMVKTLDLGRLTSNKKKLVEDLLNVFSSTDYKALKAISGTPEEKLRQIGKFIAASPVVNGESVCKQFASAINKVFGVQVINAALPADECAKQMEELLDSFSHGVAADFYLIGMDIYRDVKNIAKLVGALKVWRSAAKSKSSAPIGDSGLFAALDTIIEEFERYIQLMSTALKMQFEPTLSGILAKTEFDRSNGARLSDKIEGILRGIHSTASMALAVQVALDKIGMKPEEFKNIGNARDFYAKFAELVTSAKIEESEDPSELFSAAELIARNLGNADKLTAAMETARTGRGFSGGAPPTRTVAQLAVSKLQGKKDRAHIILNAYGLTIQGSIRKIREAIDNFASAIGTDIPLSELLDNFRDLLRQLIDIKFEAPKIHLALLGYWKDASAKETRDTMMGTLKSVAEYASFIAKDAQYSKSKAYFEAIRSSIDDMIRAVDEAADSIRPSVLGGAEGGLDGGFEGGDEDHPMTKIRELVLRDKLRLMDSVEKADYMVRVAQLKSNLSRMVTEFKADTKSYEERVLGPAVAARISKINEAHAHIKKRLSEQLPMGAATEFYPDAAPANTYDVLLNRPDKAQLERSQAFFAEYYKALTGFWESAQAIELYLKYFTNALISNPGAVKDIAMMIREVEVIAQMYDETAGDSIASIFENFRLESEGGVQYRNDLTAVADLTAAADTAVEETKSYFERTHVGGLPFSQVIGKRLSGLINESEKSLKRYMALKNLVSFFVHFGSLLGGAELRRMALRTPGEIYAGLVRFLAASSFIAGFKNTTGGQPSAITHDFSSGTFAITAPAAGVALNAGAGTFACGINTHLSSSVFMRPASDIVAGLVDEKTALDLKIENEAFSAIIKALAAKVLVLSGMYDLIDRPHEMHESRVSVRMILGAAPEEAVPKVEEAATELYVRLPLLALFYKSRFANPEKAIKGEYMDESVNGSRIMLLPDLSGSIFSDFINLIFKKFPHISTQFFADSEMRLIIAEINTIYSKLAGKYPQDTARMILSEFASTMSKMIYIISDSDRDKYDTLLAKSSQFPTPDKSGLRSETEILDILGEEGLDEDMIKHPLPADIALVDGTVDAPRDTSADSGKFVVRAEHWKLIRKFRCMIDRQLSTSSVVSLRGSIVATQVKLGQTASDLDRFKLVCGLVRGTGGSTTIDSLRKMIFLEVMGTGLGILSAIYTTIRHLQIAATASSPNVVYDAMRNAAAGGLKEVATYLAEQLSITDEHETVLQALQVAMGADQAGHIRLTTPMHGSVPGANVVAIVGPNDATRTVDLGSGAQQLDNEERQAAIRENCVFYPAAMALLLESVSAVASHTHEFVRVEISEGSLLVDFGNLISYVKKSLVALTMFADKMRPHIDPAILARYTKKEVPGSLYWLQEQFIEKLVEGRGIKAPAVGGGIVQKYRTLPELTQTIKESFDTLTKTKTRDARAQPVDYKVNYAQTLASIIAHDGGAFTAPRTGALFRTAEILANPFDALLIRGSAGEKVVDTRFLLSLAMTSENEVYNDTNSSILFSFNKLLAMFLRQMYDSATGKIFSGLIDTFAQGAFNSAILSGSNTFPDHLPHYYVSQKDAARVRSTGEPFMAGDDRDSQQVLLDYLRFLDGAGMGDHKRTFGYGRDGEIEPFVAGSLINLGGVANIHKFVAGLMLAWFAKTSNLLNEDDRFPDGSFGSFSIGPIGAIERGLALQGLKMPDISSIIAHADQLRAALNLDPTFAGNAQVAAMVAAVATKIGGVDAARTFIGDQAAFDALPGVGNVATILAMPGFTAAGVGDGYVGIINVIRAIANAGTTTFADIAGSIITKYDAYVNAVWWAITSGSAPKDCRQFSHNGGLLAFAAAGPYDPAHVIANPIPTTGLSQYLIGTLLNHSLDDVVPTNIVRDLSIITNTQARHAPALAPNDIATLTARIRPLVDTYLFPHINGLIAHAWVNSVYPRNKDRATMPVPYSAHTASIYNGVQIPALAAQPFLATQTPANEAVLAIVQRGIARIGAEIPAAAQTIAVANAKAILSNIHDGIYDNDLCRDMARTITPDESLIRANPWVSLLAYGDFATTTPRSQVIARGSILNATMGGILSTQTGGSTWDSTMFESTRSARCLALYTSLLNERYHPESRINATGIAIAIAGTTGDFAGKFAALKETTPVLVSIPVVQGASTGERIFRMSNACSRAGIVAFGNSTINGPHMADTFASFMCDVLGNSSDSDRVLREMFPQLSSSAVAKALIAGARKSVGGMEGVSRNSMTTRLLDRILHGGFIFDDNSTMTKEINKIAYTYALTAPRSFMSQAATAYGDTYAVDMQQFAIYVAARQRQRLLVFLAELWRLAQGDNDLGLFKNARVDGAVLDAETIDESNTSISIAATTDPESADLATAMLVAPNLVWHGRAVVPGINGTLTATLDNLRILADQIIVSRPEVESDPQGTRGSLTTANGFSASIRDLIETGRRIDATPGADTCGRLRALIALVARQSNAWVETIDGNSQFNIGRYMVTKAQLKNLTGADSTNIQVPGKLNQYPYIPTMVSDRNAFPEPAHITAIIEGTRVMVPNYGPDSLTTPPGTPSNISGYFKADRMVEIIRIAHDLFLQLNILADVFYAFERARTEPVGPEYVASIATFVGQIYSGLTSSPAMQDAMKATSPSNTFLRDKIFDGIMPILPRHYSDARQPAIILAGLVANVPSGSVVIGSRNASAILGQRAGFKITPTDMQTLTAIYAASNQSAAINTFIDGMKQLPPVPSTAGVKLVVPTKEMIKHIITLQEYRDATIGPANYVGNFIVYPGDESTIDDVRAYHQKVHGKEGTPAQRNMFFRRDIFDARALPDGGHVLFASLGYLLNNIMTVTDERTQLRVHLVESAADIPPYIREKYRAQIPFFRAAFDSLAHKCEFYKRLIETVSLDCFRTPRNDPDASFDHAFDRNFAQIGYGFAGNVTDKMVGVLKTISTGAGALVQDCTRALTDVGDQPHYFETSQDSISAYRAQNNGDPIMPLSGLLRVVRPRADVDLNTTTVDDALLPKFGLGDPSFKYQYAIRGLYHHLSSKGGKDIPAPLQTMSALESLVGMFNKFSHGGIKIDSGLSTDLAGCFESGFDFLHDVHRIKRFISPSKTAGIVPGDARAMTMARSLMRTTQRTATTNKTINILSAAIDSSINEVPTPFGLSAPGISNVVGIVENRNREDAIRQIVSETLSDAAKTGDPIIANIIDMNIMPFDLHVLARQMPLHFIWNYAFTFDSIAGSMLYDKMAPSQVMDSYFTGCRSDPRTAAPQQGAETPPQIRTATDALFAMLSDPYRPLTRAEKTLVDRMLIGATGIPEFARPRFLSDQLAGKILLGSILERGYPEVGPQRIALGQNITIGNTGRLADDPMERAAYASILQAFGREWQARTNTAPANIQGTLQPIIRIVGAILATMRPATSAGMNEDTYRKLSAIRLYNLTHATALGHATEAAVRATHDGHRDELKPYLDQFDKAMVACKHSGLAAVLAATHHVATPQAGLYGIEIARLDDGPARIWRDVISKWTPGQTPSNTRDLFDSASGDNRQITIGILREDVLAMDDIAREYRPNVDEYGVETHSTGIAVPHARDIHDMRMDTILARNLMHIGLVLAVVQMRLHGDVTYMHDRRVAESMSALNPSIYKFFGFQRQEAAPRARESEKRYI